MRLSKSRALIQTSNGNADDSSAAKRMIQYQPRRFLWLKILVSVWLVYHVVGLIIAPASVPPSSNLVRTSWRAFGPYLQLLFLNHGFHFFAPDPGEATIVRYIVELPDGGRVTGQIPDKKSIQPRLLYHRHFMLTEFIANGADENSTVQTLHTRAIARQLCLKHHGEAVTITRVTHRLATREWVRAGMSLEDPSLYDEKPLGRFVLSDL